MPPEHSLQPFREASHLEIDYAGELNEQQLAAVTAPPGPALVIAGAGSGKTRTLTYRVAFLLEQGIPPERILLLTFTNKAAREMMRRVADLLGQELAALWGGTFHAIGQRVLRAYARLLGYEPDFSILDREDSEHFIKACLVESGIDTKATGFAKAEVLGEIFSLAVNTQRPVADVVETEFDYFSALTREIGAMEQQYAARKRAANAMDFDDLLALWLKLLQEQEEVRQHYQRRFQFLLVDEYQDTNKLQSELIDLLAAQHHNVMAVGDDAQSIYAWRGANYANILKFPQRYPETKVYRIERNYRSTPEILSVANAAIAANAHQFPKELAPDRKSGAKPELRVCQDAAEQARFVARRVERLHEEGTRLDRIAVLYRSHFHALELQMELTRRRIPFSITSGIRFYEQAHIKDVTAYLRLVMNPRDELAFKRLVRLLPGIGGKGAEKLWQAFLVESPRSDVKSTPEGRQSKVQSPKSKAGVAEALGEIAGKAPKKAEEAWAQFEATMAQLEEEGVRGNASEMLRLAVEADYEDFLHRTYANARSRLEDVKQLIGYAEQFESCEAFLSELALMSNLDAEEDATAGREEEQLRLSTIHQAKGLEFDVVFVIMLCEGLFPATRSMETPEGEEEERRLMYVAITRARNELYLSYPLVRSGFGSGAAVQTPSRFLGEIPAKLLDENEVHPFNPYG